MYSLFEFSTFRATALIVLLCGLLSGCNPERVASVWLSAPTAPRAEPDWLNVCAYRLDEIDGTMTIANDSSMLYVRFISRDAHLQQRLEHQGVMLWLTGRNAKTERLGVHYPLGMKQGDVPFRSDRYLPDASLAPETMAGMLTLQNDQFEIVLADSTIQGSDNVNRTDELGVRVTLAKAKNGEMEYVLRVRMGELVPWIKPGARIRLAVDCAGMERPGNGDRDEFKRGMRERGDGGPGGGPGGGMRGGGRGRRPRGGERSREGKGMRQIGPIHLKFELELAKPADNKS